MQVWITEEPLSIRAIGGFSNVGGSSVLAQIDGVRILLDCGIISGAIHNPVPPSLYTIKPDVVLVSHAHIDHVGALPIVIRNNPTTPVFASLPTKRLAEIMLRDCMKLSASRGTPLYTKMEIDRCLELITETSFDTPFRFKDLTITFRKAGHILGAATIIVDGTRRIVYSGDFSTTGTPITPGPTIPNPMEKCDLMFSEVTYGGRKLERREDEEKRMLGKIKWILKEGGRVLIPSFALGRAQEVIGLLVSEMNRESIPRVSIYLDGMVKNITEVYASLADWLPDPATSKILTDWHILKPITTELERISLVFGSEPCIIIASSGMLSGGWSVVYAKDTCSRPDSAICFVGYLDEESPGHKLREMAKGEVRLLDDEVAVKCHVDQFALSAHASHEGIVDLANQYSPTFYVPMHGDQRSRWSVAKEVSNRMHAIPVVPFEEESFDIDVVGRKITPILSDSDGLAAEFLGAKDRRTQTYRDMAIELWEFLETNSVTSYPKIEQTMWSVFKLSVNYASIDPWTTITDRTRFFMACMTLLTDHFPEAAEHFTNRFHRTIPNFLANIVSYGGNRSWLAKLKEVNIESLEEVEALLLQTWKDLGVYPTLSDLFRDCKIRSEWPVNSDVESKFSRIFDEIEPLFSLLAPFPSWLKYLVVDSALVASVDELVIFVLSIVGRKHQLDTSAKQVPDLERIRNNRLFKLSGWKLDASRTTPAILALDGDEQMTGVITRGNFQIWLSKMIEPFKRDIAPGTFFVASDIPRLMSEYGFELNVQRNFIEALHKESGNKILIALSSTANQFEPYMRVQGAVVDFARFKTITRRLSSLWKHKMDARRGDAELGTEVIVSYGWHSNLSPEVRRKALEDAMETYQYSHILHILRMLENYWGKRESYKKYSVVARADREWLEQTYGLRRTAEIEGFNMAVRDFCGLSFNQTQYDRYLALVV